MIDFDMYIEKVRENYGQDCVDELLNSNFSERSNYGAGNDEYMRKFFAEHDPEYLQELESSENSDAEGESVLLKVGKGLFGILKSAGEQAKRQQEQRRREMDRDCERIDQMLDDYDQDFDQLDKEFMRSMERL